MSADLRMTKKRVAEIGGSSAARLLRKVLETEFRVTKQMIRDGYKGDCLRCPVAMSLLASFPRDDVSADYERLDIGQLRFCPPDHVERFMRRYDHTRRKASISGFRYRLTMRDLYHCFDSTKEQA